MLVSQSEFARRAGVSRQAVHEAIKNESLVSAGKKIDTEHPINAAYLVKAAVGTTKHGPKGKSGTKTAAAGSPKDAGKERKTGGREKGRKAEGRADPEAAAESKRKKIRAALEAAGMGDDGEESGGLGSVTEDMIQVVMQKSYWDTLKVKEDVLKRQLERAREVGSVIDQRILESEIGAFGQALVANFVDAPQKQAIQICQMLGVEGKEREVTEFLEKDNERRLEEAERAVRKIADSLKRRGRKQEAAA